MQCTFCSPNVISAFLLLYWILISHGARFQIYFPGSTTASVVRSATHHLMLLPSKLLMEYMPGFYLTTIFGSIHWPPTISYMWQAPFPHLIHARVSFPPSIFFMYVRPFPLFCSLTSIACPPVASPLPSHCSTSHLLLSAGIGSLSCRVVPVLIHSFIT